MERFRYDRSSKWLIEHHGDSILRLAGIEDVIAWKPLPAEIVQPRQIPDGLLEVVRRGHPEKTLYLIEIETYADRQIDEQIMDDVMLLYQARRVMPEVVLLVLRPKGQAQVLGEREVASPSGRTRLTGRWPVVELWKLPAEMMLKLHEPGLVPWISLMEYAGPPEQLLKECREILDERANPTEIGNILAVSQILASLRYNEEWLFRIFGSKEAMVITPYLQGIIDEEVEKRVALELQKRFGIEVPKKEPVVLEKDAAKEWHNGILRILAVRFGAVPADIKPNLEKNAFKTDLESLAAWAGDCPDLESFRQKLSK